MNGKDLKKEFGDYQTPFEFSKLICNILKNELNLAPKTIIEPTSGLGNFIKASEIVFPNAEKIYGIEINSKYCKLCRNEVDSEKVYVINADFFNFDIDSLFNEEETLFVGNPPWVTNSELNFNLPEKKNFKKFSGTDAITGASNFDICEYMILQILNASISKNVSIAMLCKTSVARNVLMEIGRNNISVAEQKMYNFDANKIFKISASACLLYLRISTNENRTSICDVYDINNLNVIDSKIECKDGKIRNISNKEIADFEGKCELVWRQGVKHDCSPIMELSKENDKYINKNGTILDIEDNLVFPLIKSSSFKKFIINNQFSKYAIVTQKKAREDTSYIKDTLPKTWNYLNKNKELFLKRKSSIYAGTPDFSMFGVGDYSYSAYKVGISGFYKKPIFSLIYNEKNVDKPVMFDDTSYFLSFDNYDNAYVCMLLFNSKVVQDFLLSISFRDSKRPYTKKVLQRLSIKKCLQKITLNELRITENMLGLKEFVTKDLYDNFKITITES